MKNKSYSLRYSIQKYQRLKKRYFFIQPLSCVLGFWVIFRFDSIPLCYSLCHKCSLMAQKAVHVGQGGPKRETNKE